MPEIFDPLELSKTDAATFLDLNLNKEQFDTINKIILTAVQGVFRPASKVASKIVIKTTILANPQSTNGCDVEVRVDRIEMK